MGQSVAEYTRWISDSSLKAMSTSGLSSSHTVVLTSGNQAGSSSDIHSYLLPVISQSSPGNQPAIATNVFLILGKNYGQSALSLSSRIGVSAAQRTSWDSDSSITAMPCDGLSASIRLILSAGIRIGTRTRAFTYNTPSLQAVIGIRNFPAEYHTPVAITFAGSSFGVFHLSPNFRVANTVTQETKWVSDTSIIALSGAGVFGTEGVSVTAVIARIATRTELLSYDRPVVSSSGPGNQPTTGGNPISLAGRNLGINSYSGAARISGNLESVPSNVNGGTACESNLWSSETSVVCLAPRGLLFEYGFIATVGILLSTRSQSLTYDAPVINVNILANGPTSGGNTLTVRGQSFGWLDISSKLRLGGTACMSSSWTSTSALFCQVPEGTNVMKSMSVSVQFLRATLSRSFSYDKMVLEMAYANSSNMATRNQQTRVLIIGENFGSDPQVASSMMARVGGSACEMSMWMSTSTILCKQVQGVRATLSMALTSRFRITSMSQALSYDKPSLAALLNQSNSYSMRFDHVTMAGANMGRVDFTQIMVIYSSASSRTLWISMTSMTCRIAPGTGSSGAISLTAGVQIGSLSQVHSFDKGTVMQLSPVNGGTAGNIFISLKGSAFGSVDISPSLRISSYKEASLSNSTQFDEAPSCGTAAMTTQWTSETAVIAKSSRGFFSSSSVIITVSEQVSSTSDAFSYDKPDRIFPSPPNAPTLGRLENIGARGENLGWIDFCARVRIGGTDCEHSKWVSDSEIRCGVPAGPQERGGFGLVLTVFGLKSSTCVECFTFNVPAVLSVTQNNQPTTGGSNLSIAGFNFGSIQDYSGEVRMGFTSSPSSVWTSDSQITCTVASGVSGLISAAVTFDSVVSTRSQAFTYGRPEVLFISRLFSAPSGGDMVSISGKYFGCADYTPIAYVDYEPCMSTLWKSDSLLSCRVPRGYGPGRGVAVGVAQEFGKAAIIFEYKGQHVLDAAGLPLSEHDSLKTWLDASMLALAPGSQVTQWRDRSLTGADAVVTNAATYLQRRINDLPVVFLQANKSQSLTWTNNSNAVCKIFGPGMVVSMQFTAFVVIRSSELSKDMTILSAIKRFSLDDLFEFRISMERGVPEYKMRTIVNANSVSTHSAKMTAESRFVILVLAHDGSALKTYKSSSATPLEQIHGMNGLDQYLHQKGIDSKMPDIDHVSLGCGSNGHQTKNCLEAEVAEILMYDTLLSMLDLDRVAGYLSRKYQLEWTFSTGPRITSISPTNGPTIGGTQVTLLGSFFDDSSSNVRIAFRSSHWLANCTDIDYPVIDQSKRYNTHIMFRSPPGVGFADINLFVFEVPTSVSKLWQYDAPDVTEIRPSTANSEGGTWISVFGANFGTERDGAMAIVKAADGEVACDSTDYVSHSLLLCRSPRKIYTDCQMLVIVGGQRSSSMQALIMTHVPTIYECWPEQDDCMDCCENRCTWEQVDLGIHTGLTPYECRRSCFTHCDKNLRKAAAPSKLHVVTGSRTGSSLSIAWNPPSDNGGSPILFYSISFLVQQGHEEVQRTSGIETVFKFQYLSAHSKISEVSVRAVTQFGVGQPSDPLQSISTGWPSAPSAPRGFRITGKTFNSLVLGWQAPEDHGGRPLISCRMDWSVGSIPYHKVLDADAESFSIADLPQGTLVSAIRLRCSNYDHDGIETSPAISARTHDTTPPRISVIGDFSTAAGEISHDQGFTVDDLETPAESLTVWALSLNESVVPSNGIEVRGVAQQRTVRVQPLPNVAGVAIIQVTVKDREGLMSSTTFHLTVESNWFYFFPTKGYAGSGTVITIQGAGFRTDSASYSCLIHQSNPSVSSPATSVEPHQIVCIVPAWTLPAQTITPMLLLNGRPVKQSEQAVDLAKKVSGTHKTNFLDASTVFEYVEGWNGASVSDDSGLVIIEGAGFSTIRSYECQFFDKANLEAANSMQTKASVGSSSRLSCAIPVWGSMFTATSLLLKVRGDGAAIDKRTFGLQYIPVKEFWIGQNASTGDASGGTVIMLTTRGLIVDVSQLPYECVFTSAAGNKAVSLPVSPLSPSELLCVAPDWGRKNTATTTTMTLFNRVRNLIVPFEGAPGSNTFAFTASWFQVQQKHIPASGGVLAIIGFGLHHTAPYRCWLEAEVQVGSPHVPRMISNPERTTSASTVSCNIPAWGQYYQAATVNVTLMDAHGLHVFFSGSPSLREVEVRESWLSLQPATFLASSSVTVSVRGFGFHSQRSYTCRLTWKAESFWSTQYKVAEWNTEDSYSIEEISSAPTAPEDQRTLICQLSAWGTQFAARKAVLSVVSADNSAGEVIFTGQAAASNVDIHPTWSSITPTRYGWTGLGAIRVDGAGFNSKKRHYACEWHNSFFRERSDLALPVDSQHFWCFTPNIVQYKEDSSAFISVDGEPAALTSYANLSILIIDDSQVTEIARDPPQTVFQGDFMFR